MNLFTKDKKIVYTLQLEIEVDEAWDLFNAMRYNNGCTNIAIQSTAPAKFQDLLMDYVPEIRCFFDEEQKEMEAANVQNS